MAPPGFRFKIIQSFQDPLSRQLAEAVRIDLRGENILNSKAEYSRCRVPRLRIDMEGWKEKTKARVEQTHILPVGSRQDTTLAVPVVSMDEQERQDLIDDAEDSLEELELKRKAEPQADQTGRSVRD